MQIVLSRPLRVLGRMETPPVRYSVIEIRPKWPAR